MIGSDRTATLSPPCPRRDTGSFGNRPRLPAVDATRANVGYVGGTGPETVAGLGFLGCFFPALLQRGRNPAFPCKSAILIR